MRDFGTPRRVATFSNEDELATILVDYGTRDAYHSVYDYDGENYDSAVIDCIFWDLEIAGSKARPPDFWMSFLREQAESLADFHNRLGCDVDLIDSGRGFHVVAFFDQPARLLHKRRALRRLCEQILCKVPTPAADRSVMGDIARIRRIPGTINSKTETKCEVVREYKTYGVPCMVRHWLESLDAEILAESLQPKPLSQGLPGADCSLVEELFQGAEAGKRNASAIVLVNHLKRQGLTAEQADAEMRAWGERCRPPVTDDSLTRMVARMFGRDETYHPCTLAERNLGRRCGSCRFAT